MSSLWETLVIPAPGRRVNKTGVRDLSFFSLLYHLREVLAEIEIKKKKKEDRELRIQSPLTLGTASWQK